MVALDWLIVGSYFVVLLYLGWRDRNTFSRKSGSGSAVQVILGGRFLTLPAFVATLVTTWYGGILGVGEYAYNYGISNWIVFGLPYYLGALLFALFLARKARQSQALTIPDRIRQRLGSKSAIVAAVLVFVSSAPTAYLLMLGALAHFFLGVSVVTGALIAGVFSLVYVFLGGFRAVVRTDKLQFVLMFAGFATLFAMLVNQYGFWDFLRESVPESHLSLSGGASGWYIASWYVIAQGALVEPGFHQRCYAAKDESVARRGIIISIGFWALFDFLTTTCGLYARALLPELADPTLAFPALATTILPPLALGLFVTAMLAVVMSTIDSNSFLAATTFSHDLVPARFKTAPGSLIRYTLIGLVLSTVLAFVMALAFESIVEVWREFGSVIMPALLAPVLLAFRQDKKKRLSLSDSQGVALIVFPALVSLSWVLYRHLGASGEYPFSEYSFLTEPIFPGLYVSALIVGIFWYRKKL